MVADEWLEDPTRLLRGELLVDDTALQPITAAGELIWDDLLDSVETDTAACVALRPAIRRTAS